MRGEKRCRPKTSSSASMSAPRSAATAARLRRFAPTISRRCRSANCSAAIPASTEAVDDVFYGCANQAGEDNRNVARMAALLAGLPGATPGRHHQPPVRLRPGCGRRRGAGDQGRRGRAGDRRRRREHDARAVRDGQGRGGLPAHDAEIYDTTIGWRFVNPVMKAQYGVDSMPETGENVAAGVPGHPRGAGRLRAAQPAAGRPGAGRRHLRERDRAGRRSRTGRATGARRQGRASARRHHARHARQAQADRARGRHGHGRQRLRRQRRRRRADPRLGEGGGAARADAARARPRPRLGRRAAADHGHRPGAGGRQAASSGSASRSRIST